MTRTLLPLSWLFVAILSISCGATPSARASESRAAPSSPERAGVRPNIVLILADDLGWSDLGCQGSAIVETPRIDQLAAEGMRFTDAYANAPNCAPSRASLLTGLWTPRHGILTVGTPDRGIARERKLIPTRNEVFLPGSALTIAEALRAAGYTTAHVGKWHLGEGTMGGPECHGFDVNIGGSLDGAPPSYFSPYKNDYLADGPEGEYLTDRLTDEAIRWVEANRERPFFLYLSHFAVHTPIQAKEDKTERYREKFAAMSAAGDSNLGGQDEASAQDEKRELRPGARAAANRTAARDRGRSSAYAAMIESLDESVGRVIDALDRLELTERTIVVFFSDNGGHGKITSNAPLRGAKGMLYEGGTRVPLIVRWPGVTPAASACSVPVIGSDLFPTLLEMAGVSPPSDAVVDGVSITSLLRGAKALDREALYWHCPVYLEGRDYEGSHDPNFRLRPSASIRRGKWKLIERFEDGSVELYDLESDLGETRNLAAEHAGVVAELRTFLAAWRARVGASVPTEPNPRYDPKARD